MDHYQSFPYGNFITYLNPTVPIPAPQNFETRRLEEVME